VIRAIETGDVKKLRLFSKNGDLSLFIPGWERMKSDERGWQHGFHDFRLDEHTLRLYDYTNSSHEFRNLPDRLKRVLNMTILLHDIAKAGSSIENRKYDRSHPGEIMPDPDHPGPSAEFAQKVLENLGYKPLMIKMVTKFIKYHDALGNIVIYGPRNERTKYSIDDLAHTFHDKMSIEALKILTKADISAIKDRSLLTWDRNYFSAESKKHGKGSITTEKAVDLVANMIIERL